MRNGEPPLGASPPLTASRGVAQSLRLFSATPPQRASRRRKKAARSSRRVRRGGRRHKGGLPSTPRAIRRVPLRVRRGLPNEKRRGGQTGGRKGRVPLLPPPSPQTSGSATRRGASLQSWGGSGRFDARLRAMTEGGSSDKLRPIYPPLSGPRRLGPVSCRKTRGSACVRRLSGLSGLVPWAPA